jgi:hypothetical protein
MATDTVDLTHVPQIRLGESEADEAEAIGLVGDPRLVRAFKELAEAAGFTPPGDLVPYLSAIRAVLERVGGEHRRDVALLDALAPAEIPPPARLLQLRRNADARKRLIDEFGLYASGELAELRQAQTANASAEPRRWLKEGRIFEVPAVGGGRRYPGFQFDVSGRPLPDLRPVLEVLRDVLAGWELALWFTGPNATLDGARPVDRLTRSPSEVVDAAEHERDTALSW